DRRRGGARRRAAPRQARRRRARRDRGGAASRRVGPVGSAQRHHHPALRGRTAHRRRRADRREPACAARGPRAHQHRHPLTPKNETEEPTPMSTSIRHLTRENLTSPLVQVSLDLTNNDEALRTAAVAVESGVDWIEVGTPLVLAEGLHAVRALRKEFPEHPIVVDLKTMDGGYLEAEMMGDAGADAVIVMARAHEATIEAVIAAGERFGMLVMGDDLAEDDRVAACVRMEQLGVGMVIHHIGYDHRNKHPELGLSPLTELSDIVAATGVPVQAVGGLSDRKSTRLNSSHVK